MCLSQSSSDKHTKSSPCTAGGRIRTRPLPTASIPAASTLKSSVQHYLFGLSFRPYSGRTTSKKPSFVVMLKCKKGSCNIPSSTSAISEAILPLVDTVGEHIKVLISSRRQPCLDTVGFGNCITSDVCRTDKGNNACLSLMSMPTSALTPARIIWRASVVDHSGLDGSISHPPPTSKDTGKIRTPRRGCFATDSLSDFDLSLYRSSASLCDCGVCGAADVACGD